MDGVAFFAGAADVSTAAVVGDFLTGDFFAAALRGAVFLTAGVGSGTGAATASSAETAASSAELAASSAAAAAAAATTVASVAAA